MWPSSRRRGVRVVGRGVHVAQGQFWSIRVPRRTTPLRRSALASGPRQAGARPFPVPPGVVRWLGARVGPGDLGARLVNRLFDHGIEARLATVSESDPPHFTHPCRPERDTVRTLQPDIIVTLDDTALRQVPAWCDRRSTVVVHHTGERTLTTELVSWRLGASSGRIRALHGSAVDAPTLASLCSRLCSGPFPAPPHRRGRRRGIAGPESGFGSVPVCTSPWCTGRANRAPGSPGS